VTSEIPVTAFESWRRRSTTGAVLTGIALGLRHALELKQDPPAIVQEAPGGPPADEEPFSVLLDGEHPNESVVVIRPWLFGH
jgi:hypothetical protein